MRIKHLFNSFKLKPIGLGQPSLQLRLTAGITTIALLSVGSIGTWTTWQMRKMLVVDHKNQLGQIANHLEDQLTDTAPTQWQTVLNDWTAPDLWLAAQPLQQTLMRPAQTNQLVTNLPADMAQLNWQDMPRSPTVKTLAGHHLVLCQRTLLQSGRKVGHLYLARDITHDYKVLSTLVNTLRFGTLLALIPIAALIAMYIRRALQPLRQVNQIAQAGGSMPTEPVPAEVKGLVQGLSSLSSRLSETGEKQREFTNSLSHELRTSLCLIQGYLKSTLRRGDNLTAAQREALEIANSEADRTVDLLQDLLDLGRINSRNSPCCLRPLVVNDVVEAAVKAANPEQSRVIQVEAPELLTAKADAKQLHRVLLHLLNNAKQFSPADQPIRVSLQQTPAWALIRVQDQGCGIAETEQSQIFEPFYRVEASRCRSTGGMGLGLAIVQALVKAMGGRVEVESHPGRGSTFTVRLVPETPSLESVVPKLPDRLLASEHPTPP
ncbi:MAG: sensor histidine kinase [Elainella sp.]